MLHPVVRLNSNTSAPLKSMDVPAMFHVDSMAKVAEPEILVQKDSEGLILANEECAESFVVDCPALHIIPSSSLGIGRIPHGTPADLLLLEKTKYCPLCRSREVFGKARRIPATDNPTHTRHTSSSSSSSPYLSPQPISVSSGPPPHTSSLSLSTLAERPLELPLRSSASVISNPSSLAFSSPASPPPFQTIHPLGGNYSQPSIGLPPPRRPPSIISTDTSLFESAPRSVGGFFGFRRKRAISKKPPRDDGLPPLPSSLSFSFSASGQNLLLWRRNGHSLIHIKIASRESKLLPLKRMVPQTEGDQGVNIKLTAEGNDWLAAVLYHKQSFLLLVLHSSGAHYVLHHLDPHLRPLTLSMSRDNSYIAVGYGLTVHLYYYQANRQVWKTDIYIDGFLIQDQVKAQVISFSPDSQYIIVATQRFDKMRGRDDDGMHARVWRCEERPRDCLKLEHCLLPTDHIGLTSAFFDPNFSLGFITAFIDSPYPLFLSPTADNGELASSNHYHDSRFNTPNPPNPKKTTHQFKVRCAAQSTNAFTTSFLTSTNRIYIASLKSQAVDEWADLSPFRSRTLEPQQEAAVMSMPDERTAYVVWRDNSKLWLVTVRGKGMAESADLRWLLEEVGWGD